MLNQRLDGHGQQLDRLERMIASIAGLPMPQPGTFAAPVGTEIEPTREPPPDPPPDPVTIAPDWITFADAKAVTGRRATWFWTRFNSGRLEWKNSGDGDSPAIMVRNPLVECPPGTFRTRFPIAPPPPADAVDADFITMADAESRMNRKPGNLYPYIVNGRITSRHRPNLPREVYWPDADNPPEPIQHLMALIPRVIS